ncbi:ran-binding protein (RanBP), putative [Ixodes scapularis]|uniref:Nuclear pore complex protein Nup153 n=1 Tax=Ixodes scapularis TaxID=6945 RepID=B7P3N5_IXOSC|nr:ran-binding protein (RanBP), putative [Ixodes scapularis]|eukprot:XP_002404439.1 ran-binding protein (RanBP), putative [Ixodes scapularis]
MLRTKKDVDKHVSGILARIKDEKEKHMRGFNFARLYYSVKDYDSARRHLAAYLSVNEKHSAAHKLMGQIYEATGNQEQALQSYKRSLTLEENQKDVVLKICDIYCNLPVDPETAKYWLERAQNLFPGDAVIFKLKEGMAKAGGGTNTKDLENLITSELLTRPNDVALRVKLLRLLLNSGRVQEAHKHALQAEEQPDFRLRASRSLDWLHCLADVFEEAHKHALQAEEQPDFRLRASRSLDWLHCLADVFEAYQEQGTAAVDHHFLTKYLLTLDQLAELSMSSSFALTSGSSTADGASNRTEEGAIAAVKALDCLLEKAHQQRWTRTGAWAFALQQASAQLYLHMASLLLKRTWKEGGNWQEASQWASALLLTSYAHRPPDSLHQGGWFLQMEQGQQETLRVVFLRALHRMSVSGHLVTTLCEEDKSRWLARIKGDVCTVQVRERIFQSLLGGERVPSVSWFLNDAAFLKSSLEFPTPSALRDYDKESQLLYPDSLNHLVWLALQHNGAADKKARTPESHFEAQAGWWSAAHQLHTNSAGEQLPELRRVLQRGLEVIRGIGNHGLDLPLVVHLARTFAVRSSSKREQCQDEDVCLSLEGRAALYWQLALSLLEAGSGPFASPRGPSRRLFGPSPLTTPLSSAEERALREEACMFLAVRAMNAECLEEAAEMLADLRSAEAALYTALVLKRLSQQKAGDPGMQQALLTRARNSLLLSLERGQREALNQDLTLQVRQQLEDLEALLAEANLSNGSLEEQVGSPRRGLSTSQFRNSTQSSSTPRPDRRFFETRTEADMTNIGSEASSSVTDTPPRSRTRQAARDTAGSYGTDLTEVMLRSLSLHQDIVVRSLGQMQETNRQILTEMREIGKAMATEAKQRETLMEQLVKKLEDATTRATAARSQRHREDSEYVDDYVGNYETEYDAYADYSHPEAGGGASPLVAAPAPLPLGYPPYRGQPYGGFPAAPLGYPLVPPPPPMGRPLAPPPPQAFYSPQAAAAAAAVATPGLRLAEGQPLPHFTFDISQPPPPPVPSMMPAGRLPAPPVPPPSAFSRLGPLPPPPAPTLTPPKPPNAPHAFQIPLPPTASAGQSPSFLGNAATAATAPAPASTTPQLEGLLRKGPAGGPPPASLVPEKQAPTTPVGSKTGEQAATPSPSVARRGSQRLSTGSDDYLEEAEVEGNFKPLIPLPEEVSVCTGEENEKVLFEERAKLFRFVDKEWKERGIGVLKLLENQEGKVRLLMRREQVLKVCANHNMHPSMTLTPMPNKDTAWIWDAQDFADGEPRPEKFCVRFKTPEIASRFKDAFEQAVQKSKRPRAPSSSSSVSGGGAISSPSPAAAAFSPPFSAGASFGSPKSTFGSVMAASAVSALSFGSPVAATVVASGSPPTSLPSLPATGFGKMFHPKPGAWSCHVCYVSNEANKLTCAACDSPKPDYVSNEASKPTGSTTDSQQPGSGKPKTALVQASGTKPGTSLFGEIAASKTPTASPAWTTFGAIATSKASSSVFGDIAKSKASSGATAPSLFGGCATTKVPPTVATSAHVFTFGVTMPDQKPAASASPFGGSSSGANVFGGFTFSSPPKVKEAPKEESKATPAAATTKGEAAKPSPFASFSFQSPTKKEEPKEAAASPFVMGARSEISKLSLTPPAAPSAVSLPNLAKSALGKAAPPAPAKTPRSPQEVPEEFVPNVEFEPVVPLPELVEAKTGEEDEEVLFCQRAKLYRYDGETKQWKERGVGQLKILRHGETGACRVLMRRDQVLKLCANHRILPEMKLGPLATGDRAWSWFAKDYSEGELNSEQLAVRFKTRELAEQFRQVFESCRDEAVQVVPAKVEVAQEAKTEESVQQPSVPLSQLSQFRPKQGTWSCETCYVENPTERAACVACETPRPGAAQPGPGAPSPLAALEKFASPVVGNTGFPVGPSATTPAKFSFGFPSAGAATASSQGGASSKAPGFVFGCGTQQFGGSAPPSTFTFGAAVSSANAPSSSEESSQAPGAFKFGSPQKYEFSFSGVRPRSPGKTPKSPGTPTDAEEEDAGGWTESPEADIYFQPVVPLPPKVAVKTGEEEEELLYSHRAKLYRWLDGEWKERGLGDIKLLFDPAAKRVRLLMRREPVLKVCLNHLLSRELQLTKKDDKVVLWSATDFSDGEPSPHQFALRLKTPQLADEFLAAVEAAKARLDAPPESIVPTMMTPCPPLHPTAVELVFEAKATEAQVARARELLLPDNFFLYETRPPCPGCRGCDDWDTKKKAGQSATPPAAAAPRRTTAVEKEPANVAAADSTTDEGSLFSSSSVMQFSFAELAQQGASGFGKPAGSPPKSSIPLLAGAGSKLFQSASRHKSEADDDGEEEVAPSSELHFEPVVPLPDLVELKTGEEEEEALFCSRAKLYVFHADLKQWKERAIGDIKILKHKHRPCCFRVLMRRDQVHKIACNHAITGFIRLAPLSTSANSLTWNAIDYTDGKPSPESFAVRFKNAEILDAFAKTFEECRLAVLEKENIGGSEEAVSGRNGEQEKSEQESTEKEEEDEEEEEEEEEDEEDEEDDDDHGEDVMFEKRVTLAVLSPGGDSYQMVGMGNLRMVYDDSCYGARIRVLSDDAAEGGGVPLCDTIVAVQTCLRTERLHAFWSAVDMSRNPHERRHFRVTFSSPQAVQEFDRAFTEGKELALSSSIVETIDEPPSHPK